MLGYVTADLIEPPAPDIDILNAAKKLEKALLKDYYSEKVGENDSVFRLIALLLKTYRGLKAENVTQWNPSINYVYEKSKGPKGKKYVVEERKKILNALIFLKPFVDRAYVNVGKEVQDFVLLCMIMSFQKFIKYAKPKSNDSEEEEDEKKEDEEPKDLEIVKDDIYKNFYLPDFLNFKTEIFERLDSRFRQAKSPNGLTRFVLSGDLAKFIDIMKELQDLAKQHLKYTMEAYTWSQDVTWDPSKQLKLDNISFSVEKGKKQIFILDEKGKKELDNMDAAIDEETQQIIISPKPITFFDKKKNIMTVDAKKKAPLEYKQQLIDNDAIIILMEPSGAFHPLLYRH